MVYIKRIDIKGFKTFRRKVSIHLEQGLTVITGPNGSGKSNVMDSVKFALGELSSKELRGGTFEDLISKVSPSNSSRSAYVAIQFENKDRRIPIDTDHVIVSREFMKGGEGIYRVNSKRVPRRQIADALSSSGLTLSNLNIVPQHTMTRLADTTPDERRKIIENMVGIGIYDSKKDDALSQLQQADINVKIASAKVDEVRRHVNSLEEERNKLLRSRFIQNEVKDLKARGISISIMKLEQEFKDLSRHSCDLSKKLDDLKKQRELSRKEQELMESEKNRLEQTIFEKERENIQSIDQEVINVSTAKSELNAKLEGARRTIDYLQKQLNSFDTIISTSDKRITQTQEDVKKSENTYTKINNEIYKIENERTSISSEISNWRDRYSDAYKQIDVVNKEIDTLLKTVNESDSILKTESYKQDIHNEELNNLNNRKEDLSSKLNKVSSRLLKVKKTIKDKRSTVETINQSISELTLLKERREYYLEKAYTISTKAKHVLSQAENLPKIQKNDIDEILKAVNKGLIKKVIGQLRHLISIPEKYRLALETAADGWLDALIVEDLSTALTCFKFAQKKELGTLRVIPLSNISYVKQLIIPKESKATQASDLIETTPKIQPAITYVLGDTAITESRSEAFLLSLQGIRVVSHNGDLFEPDGGIQIGDYRSTSEWFPDILNLKKLYEKLESNLEKGKNDLKEIISEIEQLQLKESKFTNELSIQERELKTFEDESISTINEINKTEKQIQIIEKTIKESEQRIRDLTINSKKQNDKLNLLKKSKHTLMNKIQTSSIKKSEKKASDLESLLDKKRKDIAQLEAYISGLKSSEDVLKKNKQRVSEQKVETEKRISEQKSQVNKISTDLQLRSKKLEDLMIKKEKLGSTMTSLRESLKDIEAKLKIKIDQINNLYEETERVSSKHATLSTSIKNIEVENAVLMRDLQSYGYDKPLLFEEYNEKNIEQFKLVLEEELNTLGAVNQLALEQYADYTYNYQGLSLKINELEKERGAIIHFMEQLDEKKRDTFLKAFKRIDTSFKRIFTNISGGGSGNLILENQEDPFKGGLEILLAFPGKAKFSIGGASGGEKSVATVCFILALQEISPMPFYMFDEIDAHLDIWNTQRLSDLLKERSKGSQFIIISLKDSTVAKADKVYGVYIGDGTSQIVELPKGEVLA